VINLLLTGARFPLALFDLRGRVPQMAGVCACWQALCFEAYIGPALGLPELLTVLLSCKMVQVFLSKGAKNSVLKSGE
jgi:hypothetical protein